MLRAIEHSREENLQDRSDRALVAVDETGTILPTLYFDSIIGCTVSVAHVERLAVKLC